jgi:peptidoglycan lytic transglycosylase G
LNRSQSSTERTEEERQRAREERERRRARASGATEPQAALTEPLVAEVPLPGAPSAPDDAQPPVVELPPMVEQPPVAELPPMAEQPFVTEQHPVVEPPLAVEHPIPAKLPPPAPPPARIPPPPVRSAGKRTRRAGLPGGGGSRHTRARIGALLALVAAAFAVWFLASLFQPFAGTERGSVIVDIPKGSSASKIGSVLAHDGVVASGFFFDVRALVEGKRGDLHSGRFQMRRDMSYAAAISALSKPPPARITVRVTIPEGETRVQIAQVAAGEDLGGSYLAASRRSGLLDPRRYGAPRSTPSLEGFLFPATYELYAGTPVRSLVAEQLAAFQENFGPLEVRRARALHLSAYQLLIVASMVEREALLAHDRPLVAAVIYNRLRLGMALGIDATIRYALNDYTHPLTEAQLRIDSPYNTRTHHGLPPTPISNPGVASIQAAAHPAHVPYLYYVDGADGCGELVFSTSSAQFERNAAAYRAALERNGGRVPTCRKR